MAASPAQATTTDNDQRQKGQQPTATSRSSSSTHMTATTHLPSSSSSAVVSSAKTLHTLLDMAEHMELSQIELIYRAEGNANLVLALPQFKKVLRLPKMLPNESMQQKQSKQQQQHAVEHQQQREHEQQQQLQSTSGPVGLQDAKVGDLTMADFVAYIEIIRRLLGNEFLFKAEIAAIPKEADRKWMNEHIRAYRPAHRLAKEFCGQFGLLLPDATQLPAAFDILLTNLQPKATLTGDTYAIEIKPKQGWLLPSDVNDLFDIKPTTTTTTTTTTQRTTSASPAPTATAAKVAKTYTRCRYCAMQFLKLQNRKITKLSSYCPIELFSGMPGRMLAALDALFECPQNNFRIFRNGNLIYGDSVSWKDLDDDVFQGDTLQLVKRLLVTCLLRDYDARVEGKETGEMARADVDVIKAVAGHPHSSATPIAAAQGSDMAAVIQAAAAAAGDVVTPETETETDAEATQAQINEAEMLCLPKNCVLQKILHLQLLSKRNLRFMSEAGYGDKSEKSYQAWGSLQKKAPGISFDTLGAVEEYMLGATALDCSVMVAFQEVVMDSLPLLSSNVVHFSECGRTFLTKVTLLDLDPKPDSHFHKYVKQTSDAYQCCKKT